MAFLFLQGKMGTSEKSSASQILRARARPIGIGRAICPGLTMKFGQLIEYNKTNIFLQKSCRK